MATRARTWELIHAATNRECAKAPYMNGEVKTRQATPEELARYREEAKRGRTKKNYLRFKEDF